MLMVGKEVVVNVLTWASVPQFPQIVMQIILLHMDAVRIIEVFTSILVLYIHKYELLKEFIVCKKCV